jgi:hypothetical protein
MRDVPSIQDKVLAALTARRSDLIDLTSSDIAALRPNRPHLSQPPAGLGAATIIPTVATAPSTAEGLRRRGLRLEYATLGWNVVGSVLVLVAAVAARSVALAGFGLDSLIEIVGSSSSGSCTRCRRSNGTGRRCG